MPNVRISLRVLGEDLTVEAPVPDGPARLDEMLPFLRELDDQVIGAAVRRVERAGAAVSCCRGCSTCCRAQPVPVTPVEAYALWKLVESLPGPRRAEIKRRFADRVRRLEEADLAEHFRNRDPNLTADKARDIAERYFRLGLVCPFLEDDACGIYHDRPFVCRQYLVTSPAELCRDPLHEAVRVIPMPLAPAGATLRIADEMLGGRHYTVPLVLALEAAQRHRQDLEKRVDPRQVLPRWIQESARNEEKAHE